MFSFFKSQPKNARRDFAHIGVDMHSHLIPGIDDGAKNLDDSLALIGRLQDLGFQKIITTPHVYQQYYPNTSETILSGLETVRAAVAERGMNIEIEAAAEYFMDETFAELIEKRDLLTLNGKYVLVEVSFFGLPPTLDLMLFRMQVNGFQPIMAHPERYTYFKSDLSGYQDLKDAGCLLQVNTLSLAGYYGPEVQKMATKLIKAGLIDLIGTDLHHERHAAALAGAFKKSDFVKTLSEYPFKNAEVLG